MALLDGRVAKGTPFERITPRLLWLVFSIGFAVSLLGIVVLSIPEMEFAALDLLERLGRFAGAVGNMALLLVFFLFVVCGFGLIVMGLRWLFRNRHKT